MTPACWRARTTTSERASDVHRSVQSAWPPESSQRPSPETAIGGAPDHASPLWARAAGEKSARWANGAADGSNREGARVEARLEREPSVDVQPTRAQQREESVGARHRAHVDDGVGRRAAAAAARQRARVVHLHRLGRVEDLARRPDLRARLARLVRPRDQLRRRLPEELDLLLHRRSVLRVEALEVDGAFVRQIVEDVQVLLRVLPVLLVPEDQIDPLVEMCGHVLRLERFAVEPHELIRRSVRPRWEPDVAEGVAPLRRAEAEVVGVAEKVGEVEELGDQFLHVRHVFEARRPRLRDRIKEPIGDVEAAALQPNVLGRVRLHPK